MQLTQWQTELGILHALTKFAEDNGKVSMWSRRVPLLLDGIISGHFNGQTTASVKRESPHHDRHQWHHALA